MTDGIKIEIDASEASSAKEKLDKLSSSVENLEQTTSNTSKTFYEAQREIAILGSASRAASKAVDEVTSSLSQSASQLKQVNNSWKSTVDAQNKSMNAYHSATRAAEQQARAETKAAAQAKGTTAENTKKKAALEKLLGVIDKTEKALSILDKQELELTTHFKAGRIEIDAYNNALAKIQSRRNALSNIKAEAKGTTVEVNKLSKAIKQLSAIAVTGIAGYGVVSFGKSVIETNIQMDKAKTIMENATGSASKAAQELDFVRSVSNKLNIELISAATSYSKLVAAASGSPSLSNEMRGMFEGVSEAAAVLKLAPHQVNSILVNYEQMISKGKVDLVDLKQIANIIPGTFEKAAKALGTNTSQLSEWISKGLVPASEFLPRFSDELHTAFGDSAQQAAQGLQGQLTSLTNAWTGLKEEAGNAGFVDTFTDAVKGLTDILKDPSVKEGLNLLIQGMAAAAKGAAKGAAEIANITKYLSEEIASYGGNIATDDISRVEQYISGTIAEINRLKGVIAYFEKNQTGIIDSALGRTSEEVIKGAQENIAKLENSLKELEKQRDEFYANENKARALSNKPLDPLVKAYEEARDHLTDIRKQIKEGNQDLDPSLAEISYKDAVDAIRVNTQELEDAYNDRATTLLTLQENFLAEAKNLSAEERAYQEEDIANTKQRMAELAQQLEKYKSILQSANALSTRTPFAPTEKPKATKAKTGKSEAQRKAEQDESYVKNLEKQKATLNMTTAEVRQYDLAEKNLTGTLAERAKVALAAIEAVEKEKQALANTKVNQALEVDLLRLNGNEFEASLLEAENKLKETIADMQKEGNSEGVTIAVKVADAEKAKAQLDNIKTQMDKFFSNQSREEQSVQAQVTAGLITQYEGQKRLTDLHKQTADLVKKSLPDLQKMAQMPGAMGEQARQYLTEINTQLLTLEKTSNELENAFRNGLQDGIQSSIEGLVKGTMDLQEALKNFVDSIASNILNVISQNIAQQATDGIMSGISGLDTMFGFGTDTDTTTPQATAIATASQEGALAMQTGIEQGAATAAQTMASALSGVNSLNANPLGGSSGILGNVTEQATQAVTAINTVTATKTAADATLAASAATSAATTQAATSAAAATATASWTPAATAASVASFGSAAMIGLTALMSVMAAFKAFATGGDVKGAGTGTSDSIPAWLSNGEFVTRAAVMKQPGARDFAHAFNRHGMAALDMYRVKHSTGGMAGIPAPSMPAPSMVGMKPVENVNNNSTTLKNSQNFYMVDDPNKFGDSIANNDHTQQNILIFLQQNQQKVKSIIG